MQARNAVDWTEEKIATLTTVDVRQLRANAERLGDAGVVERCDRVLKGRRRERAPRPKAKKWYEQGPAAEPEPSAGRDGNSEG